jgi:N-acetylglutamate synthase/N-acetylornithine aminotransferase
MFKRFSSTITLKPAPPKAHFHRPLPSSSFPTGYLATGIHVGVKKKPGVLDVGLIVSTSEHPASAAACFTRNAFKAAPVVVSDQILTQNGGRARAVVVNSGCANAVTGMFCARPVAAYLLAAPKAVKVWRTPGQWSGRPTRCCPRPSLRPIVTH